ncbi:MAG: hypothetical protein ACI9FZ_000786, partial [Bacteroidia bacterium]
SCIRIVTDVLVLTVTDVFVSNPLSGFLLHRI